MAFPPMGKTTTVCIKTFQRPQCLEVLLASLRRRFTDVPVIVADDSEQPAGKVCARYNARVLALPFDTGLSAGRNAMLAEVTTPNFVLMDDDFLINGLTDLEKLIEPLNEDDYDLVGGRLVLRDQSVQRYEGFMSEVNRELVLIRIEPEEMLTPCEIVLNFFAAKTRVIREVGWDDRLKVYEHEDFFWRCKQAGVRVGYHPHVIAQHHQERNDEYNRFRNQRIPEMRQLVMEKHGWTGIRWVHI